MQFLSKQWPSHAFRFGGGGRSPQAQAIQAAPTPLPAPPVTQDNTAVIQAEHDLAQQQLGKKSFRDSIIAGNTGGFNSQGGFGKPAPMPSGKFGGGIERNLGPRA